MGVNCNIIITFDSNDIEGQQYLRLAINKHLEIPHDHETKIFPIGNRAWEPTDLDTIVICMKDWYEEECQAFFNFLRTLQWPAPKSVQIYYREACPVVRPFTAFYLFQNVTLTDYSIISHNPLRYGP